MAKFYGDLFEEWALAALLAGGNFARFDLMDGKDAGELALSPSSKVFFFSSADLAAAVHARDTAALEATVFVPTKTNFTAVDAVLGRGRALVNFTINRKHAIKLVHSKLSNEGAAPVAAALGLCSNDGEGAFDFYWALPPDRYDAVCKQRAPLPVTDQAKRPRIAVRQFALRVPFEARRTITASSGDAAASTAPR